MSQPWFQYHNAGTALMPPPHSYNAPYYSGQVGDPIEDFLREYEELTNGCNLIEQQKVEKITHYICLELRYLWKSHNGYQAHNWANFRLELEAIYKEPSAPSQHAKRKLGDFVSPPLHTASVLRPLCVRYASIEHLLPALSILSNRWTSQMCMSRGSHLCKYVCKALSE